MFRTPQALLMLIVAALLTACGAPATSQIEEATPTPLPPAPEIERPIYTVERGVIENPLETGGRVTPVDFKALAFQRPGIVAAVNIDRGQQVEPGQVLAELEQDAELEALADAQDTVVQTQRDFESAERARSKRIEQARLDLQDAQRALELVLPGGLDDPIRKAQDELDALRREAKQTDATGSEGKTGAEYALLQATEALSDTQRKVSEAFWNADWAQKYRTDPIQPFTEVADEEGKVSRKPNPIDDKKVQEYQDAYVTAQRTLRDAERALDTAQRTLDKAREAEIVGNGTTNEKIAEAERRLNEMISGQGNSAVIAAQKTVKAARLGVEEAEAETLNSALKAVETAQRAVEKAQKKVDDGRIVAPQAGEVISVAVGPGDTAETATFVIEIADTSKLEIGAELGGDQMRQMQEGQPAEITLLSRPDVIMPAFIRQMPEPYGSGSSGNVQSRDRRTLFEITDFKNLNLSSGQNVGIRIVLERKENALMLPPDAVRSFEGRRFVIVRTAEGDRRQTVKIGIETEDMIEILEGVAAGDTIVGQ
ncbi:MAG: HlyD family efflux transporter periplasmic adaptor subunit [Roseiflexaceae bacterium]|nr:HlyD family efflux transporter periplasmic adaptor subunit [Roseiflexaceae bacterium]